MGIEHCNTSIFGLIDSLLLCIYLYIYMWLQAVINCSCEEFILWETGERKRTKCQLVFSYGTGKTM
jgi:hypothetical protein